MLQICVNALTKQGVSMGNLQNVLNGLQGISMIGKVLLLSQAI